MKRTVCRLILVAAVVFSADAAAQVKIEWSDRCQQPGSQTFFSVTVSPRGEVQYEGLKEVRQLGARRATITKAQAKEILAQIRAIVTEVTSKAPDPELAGGECLRLQMRNVHDGATVEILSMAPAARALATSLQQFIRVQDWICPARYSVPERDFICGRPVVTYTLTEKHACLQRHVTDIYADGMAHYYVTQSEFPDSYGRIAPEQVDALERLPVRSSAFEELVVPGATARAFYVTGADAIEYSNRLQQATGFKLRTLPSGKVCDYGKEFPVGDLTLPR
jgi:hypothetical protein